MKQQIGGGKKKGEKNWRKNKMWGGKKMSRKGSAHINPFFIRTYRKISSGGIGGLLSLTGTLERETKGGAVYTRYGCAWAGSVNTWGGKKSNDHAKSVGKAGSFDEAGRKKKYYGVVGEKREEGDTKRCL